MGSNCFSCFYGGKILQNDFLWIYFNRLSIFNRFSTNTISKYLYSFKSLSNWKETDLWIYDTEKLSQDICKLRK